MKKNKCESIYFFICIIDKKYDKVDIVGDIHG